MQAISHSIAISNNVQSASIAGLNGRITFPNTNGPGQQHARPEPNFIFENVDPANLDGEDDSDGDLSPSGHCQGAGQGQGHSGTTSSLKPGKKTKGRVKIKMEFIENKLRRYTTFSKRKTGIMKKAYELSTLTGTQVMLLVASETGHVYTFATRKLQPMITSESGKALIQTCLNSPDPPPGISGHMSLEQRMNPTGFEETGFTYSVGDENSKEPTPTHAARPSAQSNVATSVNPVSVLASQPAAPHSSGAADNVTIKVANIPVQFPSFIFQTSSGQSVAIPASQLGLATQPHTSQPHTTYRTAAGTVITSVANQTASGESSSAVTTPSFSILSGSGGTAVTPSQIIMYQTPQGVVYAAPTTATSVGTERTIFNFQQPATAISIPQHDTGSGQQIITIPVSLASAQQVLQLTAVPHSESLRPSVKCEGQVTPAKKARK